MRFLIYFIVLSFLTGCRWQGEQPANEQKYRSVPEDYEILQKPKKEECDSSDPFSKCTLDKVENNIKKFVKESQE